LPVKSILMTFAGINLGIELRHLDYVVGP